MELPALSASASPRRARDLQGRLEAFVVPKINVPFASWTDLLILLEDNSQFSGILTALKGVSVVCGLIRKDICLQGTRVGDQKD